MTLWIILTIMTSAAAVLVAAPFLRRLDARPADASADIEVYRDQLAEIDKEAAAGQIDSAPAETARIEIKRRLLAADRAPAPVAATFSPGERNVAVIAVVAIVVLGSVALYAAIGNPELPSAPGNPRTANVEGPSVVEQLAAATGQQTVAQPRAAPRSPTVGAQPTNGSAGPLPSVDDMIGRLAERLKRNPGDPEGWRTLGWSYLRTERFAEAATAYAKAVELSPDVASTRSSWGEAMVKAADGVVTPDAKAAFDHALRLDPKEPGARYFVGLAKAQAGDRHAALDDWLALLDDSDPKEPFVADVAEQAAELAQEIGVDVPARLRRTTAPATDGLVAAAPPAPGRLTTEQVRGALDRKPTAEEVSNAESMAPPDRMAMIRGMVEGLASRLDKSPRDADGWIKLIRSRNVLGETDAARQALDHALQVFSDAPQEQSRIEAAARQFGLTR